MALFPDSVPADTDPVKLGASVIRLLKTALNSIFSVYLNDDGTFKNNVVPGAALIDASVTKAKLASDVFPVLQLPSGVVLPFGGTVAPANFVFCDGTNYDGTNPTYAALFAAIGTNYGNSGGASHFNVPDFRGRIPVGLDAGQGRTPTIATLGATDGSATHTLSTGEIPPHRHFVANTDILSSVSPVTAGNQIAQILSQSGGDNPSYHLSGSGTDATIGQTSAVGGGGAHPIVQPSIGVNYIIRL